MKKTLTKPAAILTAIAMLFCMITVFAVAGDSDDTITEPESFSEEESSEITTYTTNIVSHRPGDINGDGSVTVSDARLCLRYVAQLETLTEEQINAAKAAHNTVNSYCARTILRAAAKLEDFSYPYFYVDLTENNGFTLDPLYSAGQYFWEYEVNGEEYGFDEEKLVINVEYGQEIHTDEDGNIKVGAPSHYIYNITVTDKEIGGTCDIKCTLRDVGNKDNILDEFTFTVTFFGTKEAVLDM